MQTLSKIFSRPKSTSTNDIITPCQMNINAYRNLSFRDFQFLGEDLQRRIRDNVTYDLRDFQFSSSVVIKMLTVRDLFTELENRAREICGPKDYKNVVSILDPKILRLYSYEPNLIEQVDFETMKKLFGMSKRFIYMPIDWRVQLVLLNYHNRSDFKETWSIFNDKIENAVQFFTYLDTKTDFAFQFLSPHTLYCIFQTDMHLNVNGLRYLRKYRKLFPQFYMLFDLKAQEKAFFDSTIKESPSGLNICEIEFACLKQFLKDFSKTTHITTQTLNSVLGNKFLFDFFLDNKSSFRVKKNYFANFEQLFKTFPDIELSADAMINIITGIKSSIMEENIKLILAQHNRYTFAKSVFDSVLLNSLLEYKQKLYCQCEVLVYLNYQFSVIMGKKHLADKKLIMEVLHNFDDFEQNISINAFNFDCKRIYANMRARTQRDENIRRTNELASPNEPAPNRISETHMTTIVTRKNSQPDFVKDKFMQEDWESPARVKRCNNMNTEPIEKSTDQCDADKIVNDSLKQIEIDYESRIEKRKLAELCKQFNNSTSNVSIISSIVSRIFKLNIRATILVIMGIAMAGAILTLIYLITSTILK